LRDWSPQEVEEWFKSIGLEDFSNLIIYKKIGGKEIIKADDDFLNDTLGLQSLAQQQMLRFAIS